MRFYAPVEDWVDDYLYEIIREPWNVFATDVLYFLACECGTGWIPYKVGTEWDDGILVIPVPMHIYTPHPLSPFTNNMRRSIKYGVLPPNDVFEETYQMIVRGPEGQEHKLTRFIDHVQEAFDDFFEAERNMRDMFMMLMYVGKMATIFHMRGTKDAPQFALTLMARALLKLSTKVPLHLAFDAMEAFATVCCMIYHREKEEEEKKKNP